MNREQPRISANELGKYVFGTPSEKKQIARSQKYPRKEIVSRYNTAQSAILRCLKGGEFSAEVLSQEIKKLKERKPLPGRQEGVHQANLTALRRFSYIIDRANPAEGEHKIIRRNASFVYQGVLISMRPDILTDAPRLKKFSFVKLRFSNHKYSTDASEIVLLLLQKYAESLMRKGVTFDFDQTKLVDCFSMQVFSGGKITSTKERWLEKAIAELKSQWMFIR